MLSRGKRQIDEKKKENDKNIRDMKMWILGLIGTIFSTIVIALLRTILVFKGGDYHA